ncbi:MAG: cobyric acid synthase, partial [Syntrophales bacterium]|nr:cobyric acid synthase [Syntrophales bacterium]
MTARKLMVQWTASSAGKSILVTALCRILKQDGYKVTPFKAQNMALNSFVTIEGGEIGRSQACQAEAAGIQPSVHMNPILLKPQADSTSQLIIRGKASGTSSAADYYKDNFKLLPYIEGSLNELASQYDVILIEGAGSPAEINLMDKEIANMRIARLADAPVILVGDIDRGGVFASIVGTMDLLPEYERNLIKGFVINKFRGDVSLVKPALDFLEKRFSRPVLGVIPYIRDIRIAQEDSVYLDERVNGTGAGRLEIAVIRLPHISNYDDFDPLESCCNVRHISSVQDLGSPNLIILPGTKSTIDDLAFLRKTGLADAVVSRALAGTPVIGICGGYQMLGGKIYDPYRAESNVSEVDGLGLLDIDTTFEVEKVTSQVSGKVVADTGILKNSRGLPIEGYEIHMGKSVSLVNNPVFQVARTNASAGAFTDGTLSRSGNIFGTYLHGIFNNGQFTGKLIDNLCALHGLPASGHLALDKEREYDDLAAEFRKNLDMA